MRVMSASVYECVCICFCVIDLQGGLLVGCMILEKILV